MHGSCFSVQTHLKPIDEVGVVGRSGIVARATQALGVKGDAAVLLWDCGLQAHATLNGSRRLANGAVKLLQSVDKLCLLAVLGRHFAPGVADVQMGQDHAAQHRLQALRDGGGVGGMR